MHDSKWLMNRPVRLGGTTVLAAGAVLVVHLAIEWYLNLTLSAGIQTAFGALAVALYLAGNGGRWPRCSDWPR
ncbi:hypothetical protein [Streptomyces rimosus]|uniref:hypothetical protein n=1 Tax=Streptomyces rimosus TaxID=1927 RepID=UPI0013311D93|nr:hypothetical protein [Streptomyces rimosus]